MSPLDNAKAARAEVDQKLKETIEKATEIGVVVDRIEALADRIEALADRIDIAVDKMFANARPAQA